jgi:hypothetical protein
MSAHQVPTAVAMASRQGQSAMMNQKLAGLSRRVKIAWRRSAAVARVFAARAACRLQGLTKHVPAAPTPGQVVRKVHA